MPDGPYEILRAYPDALPVIGDEFEAAGRDSEALAFRAGLIDEMGAIIACRAFVGVGVGGVGGGVGGVGGGGGGGVGFGVGFGFGVDVGFGFGFGVGFGGARLLKSHQQICVEFPRMHEATIGHNYLIFLPFGLAYVGRFVRPSGLSGGVFEDASNVHDTHNGANWSEIARGQQRDRVEFKKYDGPAIFPSIIAAHEWAGELPKPTR